MLSTFSLLGKKSEKINNLTLTPLIWKLGLKLYSRHLNWVLRGKSSIIESYSLFPCETTCSVRVTFTYWILKESRAQQWYIDTTVQYLEWALHCLKQTRLLREIQCSCLWCWVSATNVLFCYEIMSSIVLSDRPNHYTTLQISSVKLLELCVAAKNEYHTREHAVYKLKHGSSYYGRPTNASCKQVIFSYQIPLLGSSNLS